MKFFAVILSFIFLMLNMLPCGDEATSEKDEMAVQQEQCPDQDSSEDLCSPFCQQCHCCHVHVTDLQLAEVSIYTREISTDIFLHFQDSEEEFQYSHFQPPRV